MIELRQLIKLDGTVELQYRQILIKETDRKVGLSGFCHFEATPWQAVPIVKETKNG